MGKEKQRSPTFLENLSLYFSQYCGVTSIHGIQYLGERGRFMIEKSIWTVIITGVCYFCIFLIFKTYNKWVTSPVIVTFATTETPIWEIPFPAVTICPEVKAHPEIFNYTDVVYKKLNQEQLTEEEEAGFESLSLICDGPFVDYTFGQEQRSPFVNDSVVANLRLLTIFSLFRTITEGIHSMVNKILWLNNENTDSLVLPVFTDEGLCYAFNMINPSEILRNPEGYITNITGNASQVHKWSLEKGYQDKSMDVFPVRTFLPGFNGGALFSAYTNESHLDYLCRNVLQGFKVMVHNPAELPQSSDFFQVSLDQAFFVGIKPKMITVSEELRNYKPEDRKCYFTYERPLKYFRNYTQNNCLQECLSNYTLSKCDCIAFYMPKDEDSKICGVGNKPCMEESAVNYLSSEENDCDCLPSCTSLHYDVETFQANWDWLKAAEVTARIHNASLKFLEKDHCSLLAVYFKEMQFLSSERHELYGYVDFFSNTGGLLGLFIGFSVTSAIEILYFLTLRLGCNIRRYGKRFWSGDPGLISAEDEQQSNLTANL